MEILHLRWNLLYFCVTLSIYFRIVHNDSVYGLTRNPPVDTESAVGLNVTLKCRFEGANGTNIEWHHTPIGSERLKAIYLGGIIYRGYRERFNVTGDRKSGECNLLISDVKTEDAGKYTCLYRTDSKSADLIVLAVYPSDESCSATVPKDGAIASNVCGIEPDKLTLTCSISYRGNKMPRLEWKDTRGNTIFTNVSNPEGVNTLSVNVAVADTDEYVTCGTTYLTSAIRSTLTWKTSIKGQTLLNKTTHLNTSCDSKEINCDVSDKTRTCRRRWTTANGSVVNSATLDPKGVSNEVFTCTAECTIRQRPCFIKALTVNHNCEFSATKNDTGGIIAAVVAVICSLILLVSIVVLVIFLWKKRKRQNGSKPRGIDESQSLNDVHVEIEALASKHENPETERLDDGHNKLKAPLSIHGTSSLHQPRSEHGEKKIA